MLKWKANWSGYCKIPLRCGYRAQLPNDGFVITAYLTDTVKAGEIVWPKK
jgi:hypothetical protein